jgi:D-3-phosphoglycerate dehydrogenase / 2-oxoglutarate reductase
MTIPQIVSGIKKLVNMQDKSLKTIGILDLGYESYAYEKKLFSEKDYQLKFYEESFADLKSKKAFAAQCDGLLVRMTVIDDDFLAAMSRLKAIVRYGIGYDNINLQAASARGIPVANVQGYATNSVSDHTIALMYSCIRGINQASLTIKTNMTRPPFMDIFELHDKTLGIIGLGRIGSSLCRKVKGMFAKIYAYDPYIDNNSFVQAGVEKKDLEYILKTAHVISLHCNLTDETRHILNENSFSLMQKQPVIINTARGPVIDEQALKKALEKNVVHSAGLDVFQDEPLSEKQNYFLEHPRVVTTGHYAWYSMYAARELQKRAAHNMIDLLAGKKIADLLNDV